MCTVNSSLLVSMLSFAVFLDLVLFSNPQEHSLCHVPPDYLNNFSFSSRFLQGSMRFLSKEGVSIFVGGPEVRITNRILLRNVDIHHIFHLRVVRRTQKSNLHLRFDHSTRLHLLIR